ncbi:MAG: DUF1329 domain-containing protein [Candidatus Binataceae bacterium]
MLAGDSAATIPAGTVITKQNWQQYKQFFSDGEIYFWEGSGFWKMPDDVEMHVGKPHQFTFPRAFVEANEKYGGQTRLLREPDGRFKLENYVAGFPFPNPSGPDMGTEIAANVTYRLQPYMFAGFPDLYKSGKLGGFYTKDRFGNWAVSNVDALYRQLGYLWQPDIAHSYPQSAGAWYTEWLMVETPEQSRYTADLTIFFQDNLRDEESYVFVPALRRSLRLSVSARCAPLFGSDMTHDDQRIGWNGGVGRFEARMLRDQPLLTMQGMTSAAGKFPEQYDGFLGWPKPSWGDWEVRPVWVIDVRRIPQMAPGYCYGKRVMYIDKQYYQTQAEDLYDASGKLWKVVWIGLAPAPIDTGDGGPQMGAGALVEFYWDVQNDHVSYVTSYSQDGNTLVVDGKIPKQYDNLPKYSTPGGLMQLMR